MEAQIEVEEEIIIKFLPDDKLSPPKSAKDLFSVFKPDLDDEDVDEEEGEQDEEFKWTDKDPFEQYDPPAKGKRGRKKRAADLEATKKTKTCTQRYKKDWENIPQFKKWLSVSIIGSEYFYCKMCKIDAKCGKSEIMRHMTSKKHIKNSQSTIPKKKKFEGLLCPVFTPFDKARFDEVDYMKINDYAEYLRANNVKSVLVNDVIGEGMSLTIAERCLVTEEWIKAGQKHKLYVMVQVGGAPMKEVIRMVRHAVAKKANAIVVLPDLYTKPHDHFDLLRYIKDISDYVDTLPIWYYHYPTYTNVKIDIQKFMVDVAEIEAFVGIIHSDGSLDDVIASSAANSRLNVIVAMNYGVLGACAQGFKSLMTPALNLLPKHVDQVYKAILISDRMEEAQMKQKCISDVFAVIQEQGDLVSAMKSAMNMLTQINVGQVRRPLVELWNKQTDHMLTEFKEIGVI